ncbi:hypothetical protein LM604_00300 [Candidatus Acetothermia bacterium]|jgi:hypothetical protein|nr:hypothetical protein [Candidatus Acetothermia bacterium]
MNPDLIATEAASLRWKIEGIFIVTQVKNSQARQQVLALLDKPIIANIKELRGQLHRIVKGLQGMQLDASQVLQLYDQFYLIHQILCAWLKWLEPLLESNKGAAQVYSVLSRLISEVEELLEDFTLWPELKQRLDAIPDETRSWREVWAEL